MTVTKKTKDYVVQKLGMAGCCKSPNKPTICYEVVCKTSLEEDFAFIIADLLEDNINARRICWSINMCAHLYEHFKYTLKDAGHYPPGDQQISDN